MLEKGFTKQGYKLIKKAKKQSNQIEDFSITLKLIQLEEEILFREGILGFTKKLLELQKERQSISEKIKNLNQLRLFREQLRELQYKSGSDSYEKELKAFSNNELMSSNLKAKSNRAKEHWIYAKAAIAWYKNNHALARKWNLKMIQLFENNPSIFKSAKVLVPISNYMYTSSILKDELNFNKMLLKLEAFKKNQNIDPIYFTFIKLARLFEMYYQIGHLKNTSKTILEATEFIEQYDEQLGVTQLNLLIGLYVRACIMTRQFEQGLAFLNRLFQLKVMDAILIQTRIFLMIIYLELGWSDLILSETVSSYKMFVRYKVLNDLSKAFLKFFKGITKNPHRAKYHYERLIPKLKVAKSQRAFEHDFGFFDYLKWAEEKLESL